ncbi:hypothetical protein E4U52_007297 [Claviceps spartinae]|nr:hypothetical protein E4U52_007297 [Claviceps spartinae]
MRLYEVILERDMRLYEVILERDMRLPQDTARHVVPAYGNNTEVLHTQHHILPHESSESVNAP